jgi:hypothetical protein
MSGTATTPAGSGAGGGLVGVGGAVGRTWVASLVAAAVGVGAKEAAARGGWGAVGVGGTAVAAGGAEVDLGGTDVLVGDGVV